MNTCDQRAITNQIALELREMVCKGGCLRVIDDDGNVPAIVEVAAVSILLGSSDSMHDRKSLFGLSLSGNVALNMIGPPCRFEVHS